MSPAPALLRVGDPLRVAKEVPASPLKVGWEVRYLKPASSLGVIVEWIWGTVWYPLDHLEPVTTRVPTA